MPWRSGLILLIALAISLFTNTAGGRPAGPGVSVTFLQADPVDISVAASPGRAEIDLPLRPPRY